MFAAEFNLAGASSPFLLRKAAVLLYLHKPSDEKAKATDFKSSS
jgi:hypothetical protein